MAEEKNYLTRSDREMSPPSENDKEECHPREGGDPLLETEILQKVI